jgi:hypothetical protein
MVGFFNADADLKCHFAKPGKLSRFDPGPRLERIHQPEQNQGGLLDYLFKLD